MSDSEFAKSHLRDHLSSLLISPVSEGFWSIFNSAKELCDQNNQPDQILRTFQNMVTKIPDWSDSTLTTEVERIQKVSKCTYLDDLIMGVFIAYMKVFASLHYTGTSAEIKIDFEKPSIAKFIHELYIHSARKLWQTAYLFKETNITSETQARNRQEIENIIDQCLESVIRSFLPWESIAKKYFSNTAQEEQTKKVTFDSTQVEPEESDSESEEDIPKLMLSDETTTIDIPELPMEDPMLELEKKAKDVLVLNP